MSERSTQPLRDESSASRARNRARRTAGIAAGILLGAIAAVLIMWLSDSIRLTGTDRSPWPIVFGIPAACVVVGGVMGALLAGAAREAVVVDAPVRSEPHRAGGRAATSAEGQLPGSSVPPRVRGEEPERRGDQAGPARD